VVDRRESQLVCCDDKRREEQQYNYLFQIYDTFATLNPE